MPRPQPFPGKQGAEGNSSALGVGGAPAGRGRPGGAVAGVSPPGTAADGAGPAPRGGRAGGACGERASTARACLGACRAERSELGSVWAAAAAAACALAPAAEREGYWGPTTSTLDWCEENYAVTWYIAEFCECGRPGLRREAGREGAGLRGDAA